MLLKNWLIPETLWVLLDFLGLVTVLIAVWPRSVAAGKPVWLKLVWVTRLPFLTGRVVVVSLLVMRQLT